MKTHLRDNYYCEGFDSQYLLESTIYGFNSLLYTFIYSGKTSEIPEEIVMEVVKSTYCDLFKRHVYLQYNPNNELRIVDEYYFNTPKESIQSALTKPDGSIYEFCIIYKA